MEEYDIYRDIATRCGGTVFIGVVGPVRTGKSTLIAQMMEKLVLPHLPDSYGKERMVDELPQSGSGRTIMTTQPRFIPTEPVSLRMDGVEGFSVRFVDCVGYVVDGAMGAEEEGQQRMVRTPWFDHEIPFTQAAEVGTTKVIGDHSNIGLLVTTDGSFSGIERSAYVPAEEKAVAALKASGKPFVMILNSSEPSAGETRRLRSELEQKYAVPVLLMDVKHLEEEDLDGLMRAVLYEFPLRQIEVNVPQWIQALPEDDALAESVLEALRASAEGLSHVRDVEEMVQRFELADAKGLAVAGRNLGTGTVNLDLPMREGLFYEVLGKQCGQEIRSDAHLMSMMT